jgi:hypothetical protein
MLEQISLENILKKELIVAIRANNPDLTFNATIRAMRVACFEVLKLALENSKLEIKSVGEESIIADVYSEDNYTTIKVNSK